MCGHKNYTPQGPVGKMIRNLLLLLQIYCVITQQKASK